MEENLTIFANTTPSPATTATSKNSNNTSHKLTTILMAVLLPAYFFFSYYGNIFLVATLSKIKQRGKTWKPVDVMIFNIAIANVVITTVPALANALELVWEKWRLGNFVCYFSVYMQYHFQTVSHFCCVAIALQRYRAIAQPLKEMASKKRSTTNLVKTAWLVSVAVATVTTTMHRAGDKVGTIEVCFNTWINYPSSQGMAIASIVLSMVLYIVPICCTTVLYALLVVRLLHRSLPGDLMEEVQIRKRKWENRRVAIMILITVLVFQVCWLPTVFVQMLVSTRYRGRITEHVYRTETAATTLALSYCAITPWVFIGTVGSLRRKFKEQFKLKRFIPCRQQEQDQRKTSGEVNTIIVTTTSRS